MVRGMHVHYWIKQGHGPTWSSKICVPNGFHIPKEGDKDFGTVYAVPELIEMYNTDPQVKKVVVEYYEYWFDIAKAV